MDRERAWALFIDGFTGGPDGSAAAKRFRAGSLDAVRIDDEDRPGNPFDEFLVRNCDPAEALAMVAAAQPLPEHYITVLEDQHYHAASYERAGYHLTHSEALMVYDLRRPLPVAPMREVMVVGSAEEAAWLNANDPQGITWIRPHNLAEPHLIHYAVLVDGKPAVRGRNMHLGPAHSYVSRIYTGEAFRRHGLARALMVRLLADDAARGGQWSVLTASGMGEGLYAALGYETLGMIHIYEPQREAK